jgi:hypothetical protein
MTQDAHRPRPASTLAADLSVIARLERALCLTAAAARRTNRTLSRSRFASLVAARRRSLSA